MACWRQRQVPCWRQRQVPWPEHSLVASTLTFVILAVAVAAAGCSPSAREYQLTGQIVAIDPARQEVTIKHEDIPRFMPGMTMAFKVSARGLLEGRVPGDLVKATLVVERSDAHLRTLDRTGFAPVTEPAVATRVMDLLAAGDTVRDGVLVDETNRRRRFADWRGEVVAVTFTYTRCPLPNFCPLMDRHFKSVQDQIQGDATLRGGVTLLTVSLDPDHDSPAVLAKRAADLQANPEIWRFLTGNRDEVEQFASQFGVSIIREPGNPELVHNLRTAVIDAHGRLRTVLSGNEWTPADLVAELRNARAGR
jgi:protein SCO1/2